MELSEGICVFVSKNLTEPETFVKSKLFKALKTPANFWFTLH